MIVIDPRDMDESKYIGDEVSLAWIRRFKECKKCNDWYRDKLETKGSTMNYNKKIWRTNK